MTFLDGAADRPVDDARRFLELLGQDAMEFSFQTLPDRPGTPLSMPMHGTLEEHIDCLRELNDFGSGIFVTVAETDLKGRKTRNLVRPRAVFNEADRGVPRNLPLVPSIVVETSPGRFHLYWLSRDLTWAQFDAAMARMVASHGSDANAADRARVLRVPGFYHHKGRPFRVRIVDELTTGRVYSAEEIVAAFPPLEAPGEAQEGGEAEGAEPNGRPGRSQGRYRKEREEFAGQEAQEAGRLLVEAGLGAIQVRLQTTGPFMTDEPGHTPMLVDWADRTFWLHIGASIHQAFRGSEIGFEVWRAASLAGCPGKYDEADQRKAWDSFSVPTEAEIEAGTRRTVGTIFWIAETYCGWSAGRRGRPRVPRAGAAVPDTLLPVIEAGRAAVAAGLEKLLEAHWEAVVCRYGDGLMLRLMHYLAARLNAATGVGQMEPLEIVAKAIRTSEATTKKYVRKAAADGLIVKSDGMRVGLAGRGIVYALTMAAKVEASATPGAGEGVFVGNGVPFWYPNASYELPSLGNAPPLAADATYASATPGDVEPWLPLMPGEMATTLAEAVSTRGCRGKHVAEANVVKITVELSAWAVHEGWSADDFRRALVDVLADAGAILAQQARRSGKLADDAHKPFMAATMSKRVGALLKAIARLGKRCRLNTPGANSLAERTQQWEAKRRAEEAERVRAGAEAFRKARDGE